MQATRDETAFCCLPTAIRFYKELGIAKVAQHNDALVAYAANILPKCWNTELLQNPTTFMLVIRSPIEPTTLDAEERRHLIKLVKTILFAYSDWNTCLSCGYDPLK